MDMDWKEHKIGKDNNINEQAIKLLSDPSMICTVLFAVKENSDGTKVPVFLVSSNFLNPKLFIDDFTMLLHEHSRFNLVQGNQKS